LPRRNGSLDMHAQRQCMVAASGVVLPGMAGQVAEKYMWK